MIEGRMMMIRHGHLHDRHDTIKSPTRRFSTDGGVSYQGMSVCLLL